MFKKSEAFLYTCNNQLENKHVKATKTVKNLRINLKLHMTFMKKLKRTLKRNLSKWRNIQYLQKERF